MGRCQAGMEEEAFRMDRIERTQMKGKQLFGAPPDNRSAPGGELLDILQRFGFGEAFW